MTEQEFIAAMQSGLPPIPFPDPLTPSLVLKGNTDIEANHPDAVGADRDVQ